MKRSMPAVWAWTLPCLLALPVHGQQAASQPSQTTQTVPPPATTESVPLPGTPPRAPHTPLRGPYYVTPQDSGSTPGSPASEKSTVIFSRQDATTDAAAPTSTPSTGKPADVSSSSVTITVTDEERTSITFTSYDLEVHLVPSEHSLSVHATMLLRNDGHRPLQHLVLQISSQLDWYSINTNGKSLPFIAHTIDSDTDHTGKLKEAVATLPQPLAPGAVLPVDVIYSGDVSQSAERLLRIGAPSTVALSSDWDRLTPEFSGLRGFGNVVWYPVSTQPAFLGDGAKLFDAIGQWKLREADASIRLHVLAEYRGQAPNFAILNGKLIGPDTPEKVKPPASNLGMHADFTDDVLHVASFTLPTSRLGFHTLGLFVMTRTQLQAKGVRVYARDTNDADAASYQDAAELVKPMIEQWLGTRQKRLVILVDLPESSDLPYEDRNVIFLPLTQDSAKDQTPLLVHMMSHAYFISPRIWLDEGVAQFMTTLWTDHVAGRDTAIEQLDSRRAALALAEPATPGEGAGQSLIEAYSDVYYRDKSAYVFWMMRGIVGDSQLAGVLRSYDPAQDREPSYLQRLTEQTSHKNVEWFFDDWIYRDRGLPDFKISSVYSRPLIHNNTGNYLVSVDIANDGYCAAEVPVKLQSGATDQSSRLLVPARDKATVRILMESLPDVVVVNDGTVPETETNTHQQEIKGPQPSN